MTTITTRTVLLSISAPPKISDVIRDSYGPFKVTGGSVSLTIPATTMTGDLILAVVQPDDYYTTVTEPTGWDYYFNAGATGAAGSGRDYPGLQLYPMYKVAAGTAGSLSTDAGTTVTVDVEYNTPTEAFTGDSIAVLYVLNNEYITGSYAYSGSKVDFATFDYYNDTPPITATAPSLTTTTAHEIVFYMLGSYGSVGVTPNETELCNFQITGCSLYIGGRIYPSAMATGTHTFSQDTPAYNVGAILAIPST